VKIAIDTMIFDVDGTLVDSKKDIANAMNYTLRSLGIKEKSCATIASYIGTGVKDLVRKSLGNGYLDLADKAEKIFTGYYIKHSAVESRLYPHVKETLDHFKGKRKFILTNRYRRFAEATLAELGIKDYFEDMLGGDDEYCMKPSACILDRMFSGLKIDKDKAMIVGDMAIDIETGKNSSIKTCWVTYGLGKKKDLRALKPDYIIDDISELKKIIFL